MIPIYERALPGDPVGGIHELMPELSTIPEQDRILSAAPLVMSSPIQSASVPTWEQEATMLFIRIR
jgi:hypothetical protein